MKKTRLLTSLFALALLASCGGEATTNTATTPATTADTATTDTGATTDQTTPEQTTPEETTPEETTANPSDTLTKEMVAELKGGLALQGIVQTYFVDYEMGWYELYELAGNNEYYYSTYADLEEIVDEETGETTGFKDPEHFTSMYFQKAQPFTEIDPETEEEVTYEDKTAVVTLGLDNKVHEQHPFSFSDGSYYAWADTGFSAIFDGISASDFVADEDYFGEGEGEGLYAFTADFDALAEGDDELKEYYDGITSKVVDFLYGSVGNYPLNTLTFVTDGYHIVSIDAYSYQPDETGFYGDTWQKFVYDVVAYGADVEVEEVKPIEGDSIADLDNAFAALAGANYSVTGAKLTFNPEDPEAEPVTEEMLEEYSVNGLVLSYVMDEDYNLAKNPKCFQIGQTQSGLLLQQEYTMVGDNFYYDEYPTTKVTKEILDFNISSKFFTYDETTESYVFDYDTVSALVPGMTTDFDMGYLTYGSTMDIDRLEIQIQEEGIVLDAYYGNSVYELMYYDIQKTERPAEVVGNGNDLTWYDLCYGMDYYDVAVEIAGSEDLLLEVPTIGGYYNYAGLYAAAKDEADPESSDIIQFQYPVLALYGDIFSSYEARLTAAGYTITTPFDGQHANVVAEKIVETEEGKKIKINVDFWAYAPQNSSTKYLIVEPTFTPVEEELPFAGNWTTIMPAYDEGGEVTGSEDVTLVINNDLTGSYRGLSVTFTENNGTYTYEGDKYSISFTYDAEQDIINLTHENKTPHWVETVQFTRKL
ncbi:MAG: hypothetical protein IJ194_01955 [Bacilli bacterium]|nr:hypothetical protein [Bacilli bacterium]